MPKPDAIPDLTVLKDIALVEGEPVFNEPWEAHAFAFTIALHEKGAFSWTEWADALSTEIHGEEDRPYYGHWLSALENLVAKKGMTTSSALISRKNEWHQAAARTPHGQPIELSK